MEILICTDGSNSSIQSADLISKLGFPAASRIVVLGVSEYKTDVDKLHISMDHINEMLGDKYSLSNKIRYGNPTEEILAEALEFSYSLVAVGGGGGQLGLLHPKLGSTTSNLVRKLRTHFLVARNVPDRIGKILICVGAEEAASETVTLGGAWISNTPAQIGLLHVVSLKQKTDFVNNAIHPSRIQLSEADTGPHPLILERAIGKLREAGVKNEIITHFRQGLVVEEALNELSAGGYDLLVVGAHYQPGQDRWQSTLLDDITDQLLNRSTCSVLII